MPRSSLTMTPAAGSSMPTTAPSGSNSSGSSATVGGSTSAHAHGPEEQPEEHLVSALQAALHSLSGPTRSSGEHPAAITTPPMTIYPSPPTRSEVHSPREKSHAPTLDISVASDQLYLRGTGVDVEPTLLSGNVVLHLSEPTSIKQVVLVFRGKAHVPSNPHDPHVLNSSPNQYIVCSHEWTFLEGEKNHSHTLKAGRHLFPFELRLGGALPSSLATYVNGGASISYKLRATAIRPGLAANLTVSIPITLLRTFATESLEYQQTLEIENTWPEKLMYSLMIPHKAWAAGDELRAMLKFAPLAKGVRVLTVTTHLCETTKMLARGGHLEKTRNVVTRKHEIVNGQAVSVEDQQRKRLHNALRKTLGEQGGAQTGVSGLSSHSGTSSPGLATGGTSAFVSGTSTPVLEGLVLARSGTRDSSGSAGSAGAPVGSSSGQTANIQPEEQVNDGDSSEITTSITVPLPPSLTPSHSLDPIIVSYRIRWSVLLANLDGHTSELRCSLPVHILDYSLLEEARAATLVTRRLLFGGEDAAQTEGEEETQLPSYPSHVRDRVAVEIPSETALATQRSSGASTPLYEGASYPLSDFPGFIQDSASASPFAFGAPLSRVQTQNTIALATLRNSHSSAGGTPPDSSSAESSRPNTRPSSQHERDGSSSGGGWGPFSRPRLHSRTNSRAPSPERASQSPQLHAHAASGIPATTAMVPSASRADETHVHASNAASRQTHGLFSVTMKPLTSLTGFSAPWHANSHTAVLAQHFQNTHAHAQRSAATQGHGPLGSGVIVTSASTGDLQALVQNSGGGRGSGGGGRTAPTTPGTPNELLTTSLSMSDVPDYFTASYGSGSAVPPLESFRGLPSYEDSEAQASLLRTSPMREAQAGESAGSSMSEAQRSFSDSDLVSMFARARGAEVQRVR
ncbi:hypothetical protein ACEPAH_6936 [Sanghuangporus vaninii]